MQIGDLVKYAKPCPDRQEEHLLGIILDIQTDFNDDIDLFPDEDLFLISWCGIRRWVYSGLLEVVNEGR